MSNPRPSEWPPGAFGWCVKCDRPLLTHRDPWMPAIPFLTTHGGIQHQHCPPALTVVANNDTKEQQHG